jgi:hypothetical protein
MGKILRHEAVDFYQLSWQEFERLCADILRMRDLRNVRLRRLVMRQTLKIVRLLSIATIFWCTPFAFGESEPKVMPLWPHGAPGYGNHINIVIPILFIAEYLTLSFLRDLSRAKSKEQESRPAQLEYYAIFSAIFN